eukprot:TRINITY_DN2462_c0_g1_i1.p1 TRINITY_DN2462_c0_g1~~TRINITY_DN2462_c0_g1_i1.p1  ORF type:complete len:653 (+),score=147.30 TRINITY_DN2462_c0_g1_i1:106-2064(+)
MSSSSSSSTRPTIQDVLENGDSAFGEQQHNDTYVNEKEKEEVLIEGFCVECADQPADCTCVQCQDQYCSVCFQALHRKGTRKTHEKKLLKEEEAKPAPVAAKRKSEDVEMGEKSETEKSDENNKRNEDSESEEEEEDEEVDNEHPFVQSNLPRGWFFERAKYIPLRLNLEERKKLRLLEAALHVSEYTDHVDILSFSNKAKRIVQQLQEMCAIISGLMVASDYRAGQKLLVDREFRDNAEFFAQIFEIGRRHKIMNPEKMRSEYGKMIHLLQDSQIPEIKELLGFTLVRPIRSVYLLLEERESLDLLHDQYIAVATMEIIPEGKSRHSIQTEIKNKERAIKYLSRKYSSKSLSESEIEWCLYSIGDNHAYLRGSRDPVDKMISYLQKYFDPKVEGKSEKDNDNSSSSRHGFSLFGFGMGEKSSVSDGRDNPHSLSIRFGKNGARLTHSHAHQYHYVLQSMILWREVMHDMFRLWTLSETDLLDDESPYRLRDTGQGLNRVQACPRVGRSMHAIVNKTMARVGPDNWVGSTVIHLGDHNVPNALTFIDKYTQVPRILNPLVICLDKIEEVMSNPEVKKYIDSAFGGLEELRRMILADFFKYAFDGSGAEDFFSAGSCIDGRLTSAWNWCSQIEKKVYFPVFLLTGFIGFDGDF